MSTESLLALLAILTLLLAAIGWYAWQLRRSIRELEQALHRAEAAGREQASRIAALEQLRESQQLAEQAVETGTALVREVHRGIAGIPFGILEAIPGTRAPAQVVRGLHDAISEGIYGAISGLNKGVGRELRKGLQAPPTPPAQEPEGIPPPAAPPLPAPDSTEDGPDDPPPPSDRPWKNWG